MTLRVRSGCHTSSPRPRLLPPRRRWAKTVLRPAAGAVVAPPFDDMSLRSVAGRQMDGLRAQVSTSRGDLDALRDRADVSEARADEVQHRADANQATTGRCMRHRECRAREPGGSLSVGLRRLRRVVVGTGPHTGPRRPGTRIVRLGSDRGREAADLRFPEPSAGQPVGQHPEHPSPATPFLGGVDAGAPSWFRRGRHRQS